MQGPKAKAALPARQKAFTDKDEAIEVRAAAARAIAEITETDAAGLYGKVPDVQDRLVTATRERSMLAQRPTPYWEAHFATDPISVQARQFALYNRTPRSGKAALQLATGQDVKAANAGSVVQYAATTSRRGIAEAKSFGDGKMSEDLNIFLYVFGADSRHYPGRFEADVEQIAKEYVFHSVDITAAEHEDKSRYVPKSAVDLGKDPAPNQVHLHRRSHQRPLAQ